jgi:hypothetical protein
MMPSQRMKINKRCVLVSDRNDSPLQTYFQMVGVDVNILTWQQISEATLANTQVLIVDRDTRIEYLSIEEKIGSWIRNGGHFVVLPQFSLANRQYIINKSLAFRRTLPYPVKNLNGSKEYLDCLPKNDAVIRGVLDCAAPSSFTAILTTKDGTPVLAQRREGRGSIVISALDLDVWIGRVDPAGFELFAKVLFSL